MFPDPSSSPASYAKYFFIRFPQVVAAANAEGGSWIPTFSNVVHFEVDIGLTWGTDLPETQLAPFYGFSPVIKTLRMSISVALSPHVFDLIRSFPLLEALSLNHSSFDRWIGGGDDFIWQPAGVILPLNPPAFTGTLELSLETGIDPAASWLLSLPRGPHFRELCLTWKCKEDVALTTALIEKCSSTLESLVIGPRPGSGTLILHLPLH